MNKLLFHVDAFTAEPFQGNPAGVMISSGVLTEEFMQTLAAELNLSETAFLSPQDGGYRIRFYTPETEIELCGHATLSAAHILYENELVQAEAPLRLFSRAGELMVSYDSGLIIMDFPAYKLKKVEISDELKKVSGLNAIELFHCDYDWYLARLGSEKEVLDAEPDFCKLKKSKYRNLIITAATKEEGIDFVVRCFVPGMGINEDPVTGSAHCALTPYWAGVTGKSEFTSYQASKRGGYLSLRLEEKRVIIAGNAVTIMQSELLAF
ncbi:MAG: PhzF family phenazine biosynthesis protein [Marinilabiliaceae bacterium]|jgi:PhzF family phenazine biosynthesis protein|nr:PhzF family phenazine biosynthesis protein [Marinilabiliaceae bacterium]